MVTAAFALLREAVIWTRHFLLAARVAYPAEANRIGGAFARASFQIAFTIAVAGHDSFPTINNSIFEAATLLIHATPALIRRCACAISGFQVAGAMTTAIKRTLLLTTIGSSPWFGTLALAELGVTKAMPTATIRAVFITAVCTSVSWLARAGSVILAVPFAMAGLSGFGGVGTFAL
jgi:hypothetical protein